MQLKYVNPDAKTQDIQLPSIQVEPLVYGQVYEVADNLGMLLAAMPFWEKVEPKSVAKETPKRATRAPIEKEMTNATPDS